MTKTPQLLIQGYRFELTCQACPEQYDVYDLAGTQVAYCRLRHGHFRVNCPEHGGDIVYAVNTIGDGIFEPGERMGHLMIAALKIQEWIAEQMFKPYSLCNYEEEI